MHGWRIAERIETHSHDRLRCEDDLTGRPAALEGSVGIRDAFERKPPADDDPKLATYGERE